MTCFRTRSKLKNKMILLSKIIIMDRESEGTVALKQKDKNRNNGLNLII